ncbi:MAG: caspase family protein [Desulfovibrionaceae bacterium]|nr:caspase family protein [Desulfovibrionaceae bacterium]
MRRWKFVFMAACLLLAGCVTVAPQYTDPLAGVRGVGTGGQGPSWDLRLGVMLSENVAKSRQYVEQQRTFYIQMSGPFASPGAINELNPDYIPNNLDEILKRRFKEVVPVKTVQEAAELGLDLCAVIDVQVTLGSSSGQKSKARLEAIFMDPAGGIIERVAAEGEDTVPFPAMNFAFASASNAALESFTAGLDGSEKLLAAIKALESAEAQKADVQAEREEALPPAAAFAVHGRRVALVIGNGAYPQAPLKNPVHDAKDMAAALQKLGFEVILRQDVGQRPMEDAISRFWSKLKRGGTGLFYFAGHGIQVEGRNYLVPVDADLESESDVRFECVDAGRVLGKMEDAGNELNIVILDACRNNPFARSFRSAGRGLAKMDAPTGSLIAYATAPGAIAADGEGRNGVYTKHLLRNIAVPGLAVSDVFMRVRMGVVEETGKKQVPWEASSLTGYFYFAGGPEK